MHKAVESALQQQTTKEIILVDDGSKTPIQNVWGDAVKVVRHRKNRGLSAALNTGISISQGDRFIIISSDDQLHPSALGIMSQFDADLVSCDMQVAGRPVRAKPGSLNLLLKSNCHSYAALIKKEIWAKIGGYKEAMNPSWEDWEFFLNAAKHGANWHHVSMPLHIYNRNPHGRDADAQGKDYLLRGKLQGYHQDLYGKGKGIVTFVIPCFNHEQYLPEAVQSALMQIYPHIRVIVVDDGSPGDTRKALTEFIDDDRAVLVRQRNKHLSGARNTGIRTAIERFNSEYLVVLDADDKVHPQFVERVMGYLRPNTYAYPDIQFIGDAHHNFQTQDYDCRKLTKRHLHQCTFLMPTAMYTAIANKRKYGYDEQMKEGYEDWEFLLAALQSGWCGTRVPEYLFYYRFHANGSMRTEAAKVNNKLVNYIKSKHPWMQSKEKVDMACKTCGGMKYTKFVNGGSSRIMVNVPGIGQVDGGQALSATYTGSTTSTMTKVGVAGTIYKYSANPGGTFPPTFTIFAKDIHLFINGPFDVRALEVPKTEIQEEQPVNAIHTRATINDKLEAQRKGREEQVVEDLNHKMAQVVYAPDDFTEIKGVGPASAQKLTDAGMSFFEDLAEATEDEVAQILSISNKKASAIIADARLAVEELEPVA